MTSSEFELTAKKAIAKMIKDRTAVEVSPYQIEMLSLYNAPCLCIEGIFKEPGYSSQMRMYKVYYDYPESYMVVNLYENTGFMMFELDEVQRDD